MREGYVRISFFLLGILISAYNSIIRYEELSSLSWGISGAAGLIFTIFLLGFWSEKFGAGKIISATIFLLLSIFVLPRLLWKNEEGSNTLWAKVNMTDTSLKVEAETMDCDRKIVLNETKFSDCDLECPIEFPGICETFNYMFLCKSKEEKEEGNIVIFGRELKLLSMVEGCGWSEYRMRYANKVDMKLAPGCRLYCRARVSLTGEESHSYSWILKEGLTLSSIVLVFSLRILMEGGLLLTKKHRNYGYVYSFFILGIVSIEPFAPYIRAAWSETANTIVFASIFSVSGCILLILILGLNCFTKKNEEELEISSQNTFTHQISCLFRKQKCVFFEIVCFSFVTGLEFSRNNSYLESIDFYHGSKGLLALHSFRGALLSGVMLPLLGDAAVERFGAGICLKTALIFQGIELLSFGRLSGIAYAVIRFLIYPLSTDLGIFTVIKYASTRFSKSGYIRMPTYAVLSCFYFGIWGNAFGIYLQKRCDRFVNVYIGSAIISGFFILHSMEWWRERRIRMKNRRPFSDSP